MSQLATEHAQSWEHRRALVNGVDLHYVVAGQGPLVVLLHGFPECWYSWRHQIGPLAATNTVVAVDQRGYNDSSKPPAVDDYDLEYLIEDVRALIEHCGHDRATIIGHDWGGAVAWAFAMRYPERTARLAVLNLPHPSLFMRALRTNPRQIRRSWYFAFFQVPRLPEWLLSRDNYGALAWVFALLARRSASFSEEDLVVYRAAWGQPGAMTAMINWYRAVVRTRGRTYRGLPHRIAQPTLLIWGTDDSALGQELTYGTERYALDLRVRYLDGISHWVQQEAPDAVNAMLVPFVRGEW
jgi:pimeloyl-ACP methyl ester carboxylesterase